MEEAGVPGENHHPTSSHCQTLSHNVVSSTPRLTGIRTHNVSGDMQVVVNLAANTIRSRPRRPLALLVMTSNSQTLLTVLIGYVQNVD